MKRSILYCSLFLTVFTSLAVFAERSRVPYVGSDEFDKLTANSRLFVDKSLLIRGIIENEKDVVLITRPRRWGKSVNMNMLWRFFNQEVDSKGKALTPQPYRSLFEKLKIAQETTNILDLYQGRYPTIYISFKDAKASKFVELKRLVGYQIYKAYNDHRYLSSSSVLSAVNKKEFSSRLVHYHRFIDTDPDQDMSKLEVLPISDSLVVLSELLFLHHGQKPYIFIDEYDTPIHSAYTKGYFEETLELIRGLFGSTLKGNSYLEKGVVTGILRIAKANLFSGANNFVEDSILTGSLTPYYGFTETEVDQLLAEAKISTAKKQELKNFYNGYQTNGLEIYNPWSVANYIQSQELRSYWLDTGGTDMINHVIYSETIQQDFERLRRGESIQKEIEAEINAFDLSSPETIWPLLLYAGYLTLDGEPTLKDTAYDCKLRIPNSELKGQFGKFYKQYLQSKQLTIPMGPGVSFDVVNALYAAIIKHRSQEVSRILSENQIDFSGAWQINPIHLAAAAGDQAVLKTVLEHHKKLFSVSGVEGLKPVDFAFLTNHTLPALKGAQITLKSPGNIEAVVCSSMGRWAAMAFTGGGMGFLLKKGLSAWLTGVLPPWVQRGLSWTVGAGAGWAGKTGLKTAASDFCVPYDRFTNIDISKPTTLNTLKGFERYRLEHPKSYVTLDPGCKEAGAEITKISIKPIEFPYTSLHPISLTLCHPNNELPRDGFEESDF